MTTDVATEALTVLGDDAASLGVAGRLALDGHDVTVWLPPSSREASALLCERPRLRLVEEGGEAAVTLSAVTNDSFAALAASDLLVTCAPLNAQAVLNDLLLPLVEPRHTLMLLPGGLCTLAHAKWLKDRGRGAAGLPTLVESDTAPLIAHMLAPDVVHVTATVTGPGFGVFPACRTVETMPMLERLFAGAHAHPHVLSAALGELTPVVRTPALFMNAAAAQRRCAESSVLRGGFTPVVAHLAAAIDAERLAVAEALGIVLPAAAEALHLRGLGPRGDLWSTVNGSFALTRTPDEMSTVGRPVDDGVVMLRTWADLADQLCVAARASRALVTLHELATGLVSSTARSLADLGIGGMNEAALAHFLNTGSDGPTS